MAQEQAYLNALQDATFYTIRGDVLELQGMDGATLVSYQAQTENAA